MKLILGTMNMGDPDKSAFGFQARISGQPAVEAVLRSFHNGGHAELDTARVVR